MAIASTSRRVSGPAFSNHSRHRTRRHFSSTPVQHLPRRSHYDTLSVPRNATRNQIKSSFYKISKEFHPDVNKSDTAKEKFQAASEAYSVLGDERQRRAYDRTLHEPSHHYDPRHEPGPTQDPGEWAFETRRRGASYAWEQQRQRARTWQAHGRPPPGRHYDPHGFDPWGGPHDFVQREAARARANAHYRHPPPHEDFYNNPWAKQNGRRTTGQEKFGEGIESISPLGRALGVIGIVLIVATVGGGWSAKA